jgi:CubicO group peptidase (beta-lactamase class C family)
MTTLPLLIAALVQASGLAQAVDSMAAERQFSGVVLIARDGTPIVEKSYGLADREAGRPNNIETAFNIGSINKLFTSIAIRQLTAAAKLDVDASLGTYWPDYPNPAARRVTIRQLLEHRSGIGGNIFAAPPGKTRRDLRALADFLPLFAAEPLRFEPGSRQEYSNAGYIVLGLLIERLSGESYYDYVRRHIYEPAGMTRTGHWAVDSLPENTAVGYTNAAEGRSEAQRVRNTDLLPGRGSSAGGGYSTAHDLLRLLHAVRAGKLPQVLPRGAGIGGGAPGLNVALESDLPGGYDIIVLANADPPAATALARELRARL